MKKLITALCLMLLLFTACGTAEQQEEGITTVILYTDNVLKVKLDASVYSLDPAFVSTGNELLLARLLYSGLCKEENGEIVGDLALYWDVSADATVYTFYLRDKLRFSDGAELKPQDVKASWERVLRVGAPCAYLFGNIKGAAAVASGSSSELSGISTDSNSLTVELQHSDSRFAEKLCHVGASVLKRTEVNASNGIMALPSTVGHYNTLPNGTGRFRLSEWLEGQSMALTANSRFNGEASGVRRLEIDFSSSVSDALMKLQWSEIDAVQNILPSQIPVDMSYEELALLPGSQRGFTFIMLNPLWRSGDDAPFELQYARLAFLQLLDTEKLNEAVNAGMALTGTGMTEYWYSVHDDVTLMRDYTPVGNYEWNIKLTRLPIICGASEQEKATAAAVSEILAEQGIECSVRSLGYTELLQAMSSAADAAVFICEYNDKGGELCDFFRLYIDGQGMFELTEATQDLLDGLLSANGGSTETDKNGFAQVEKELCARGAFKLLWYRQNSYAYNDKLRGLDANLAEVLE